MAKFKTRNTFFLKSQDILFLVGKITDGKIKIGMKFTFQNKEFIVNHIEFIDGKEDNIPFSHIALGITPNDKSLFGSTLSETNPVEIEIH
jgi:hypothetical protein